jgi:hypothetical protein
LRQESSGKEEVLDALKPFSATLRVTNPVRQSLASSRKRVLRAVLGRPSPRSVDSQSQSRALEPRKNLVVGAFVVDATGAVLAHFSGLVCPVLPGSENRAKGQQGCRGTWEALVVSLRIVPDVGTG